MNADQIAIQLYTLRDHTTRDMIGTLHRVADLGYRGVEFAGFGNASPADVAQTLTSRGLHPVAAHIPLDDLRKRPASVVDDMATLGCDFGVIPWLTKSEYRRRGAIKRLILDFAEIGTRFAAAGLRLGYHNHSFEFSSTDHSRLWDSILAVSPALLIELDVYWAAYAGMPPAPLIAALNGRVKLLHMKDMSPGPDRAMAPPGAGLLPWAAIVEAGESVGVEWYVVEVDDHPDPLGAAADGLAFLRSLTT